jgi:hypothetical protein
MKNKGFAVQCRLDRRLAPEQDNQLSRPFRMGVRRGVIHLRKQMHVEFDAGSVGHGRDRFGFRCVEDDARAGADLILYFLSVTLYWPMNWGMFSQMEPILRSWT